MYYLSSCFSLTLAFSCISFISLRRRRRSWASFIASIVLMINAMISFEKIWLRDLESNQILWDMSPAYEDQPTLPHGGISTSRKFWSEWRESNSRRNLGKIAYYHYTTLTYFQDISLKHFLRYIYTNPIEQLCVYDDILNT